MNNSFLQNAKFIGSFPSTKNLPLDEGTEIAFCGRSNCGKSSILNALTNNKKLAKTSKTPGRTQSINVFDIESNNNLKIIDLPGYGYAKVSKRLRSIWGKEIEEYLMFRKSLKAICVIMDIRHPFKEDDLNLIKWSKEKDLPVILLLNKSDKLSKNKVFQAVEKAKNNLEKLSIKSVIIATSATNKTGIDSLTEMVKQIK